MCIPCGNCSTYGEMGIDVRQYALANIDVKRASCVGCGLCAQVCPRGVLKLETTADSRAASQSACTRSICRHSALDQELAPKLSLPDHSICRVSPVTRL